MDSSEKQPVLKNAIFLSNLFLILALQKVLNNSQILQRRRWAGKSLTEASVAAGNMQDVEDGKWWLPLGQVAPLEGRVALQASVLHSKEEQGRAGNKQPWKELVITVLLLRGMWNHRLNRDTFTCSYLFLWNNCRVKRKKNTTIKRLLICVELW